MAKKRRYNPQYYKRKKLNLDEVSDTSETFDDKSGYGLSTKDTYDKVDEVPPPFEGERSQKFITWSDLGLAYKITAIACVIIVTVIVPSIWFASGLNTKVTNLKEDVIEIKQATKDMAGTSIKNTSRLNHIEKDLDEVKNKIDRSNHLINQPRRPNNRIHSDTQS